MFLINAADPLSGLKLVWECDALAHCIIEHHQGYLCLFTDAPIGGQSVDCHYLLCSPLDASSNPRKWEVVWNITSLCVYYWHFSFLLLFYVYTKHAFTWDSSICFSCFFSLPVIVSALTCWFCLIIRRKYLLMIQIWQLWMLILVINTWHS